MGFRPSDEEQRWAKRVELDLRKELYENLNEEELEELRELHWRKCPRDGVDLIRLQIDKTGIEIDKCVICGGIWIDRRDLERLLQSSKRPGVLLKLISKSLDIELPKIEEE